MPDYQKKNSTSFKKGKEHPNYRGGKIIDSHGYLLILKEDGTGYEKEHRIVAEKMINRKLFSDEVVHHIDHNKKNNNPKNLCVMKHSEHTRLHNLGKKASDKTKKYLKKIRKDRNSNLRHECWDYSYSLDDILLMLELGYSKKQISKELEVDVNTIRKRMKTYFILIKKHYKGVDHVSK